MVRRSVVTKLWLAIVTLFAVTLAILLASVTTVVTNFYVKTRLDELDRHGGEIVRLVQAGQVAPDADELVNLVATMSGAMVMIVGPHGEVITCSGNMAPGDPALIRMMHDVAAALAGKRSWSLARTSLVPEPVLSLALPLQVGGQPAALVFLAPTGPIRETISAVELVLLVIALAGAGIITVLALLLSRRLSRPLLHMAESAAEMAAGNFQRRIEVTSDDEVGQLGRSMNNLSDQLQHTLSALAAERDQLAAVLARERQLVQAQKEFVANVSHELRTPLTYLQGYTEALLDGLVGPAEQRNYLQVILDESQRLRRLVSDLLDLTVIESGQAPLRPERVPMVQLISEVAASLRPLAQAKGVRICEPDEQLALVAWTDPDRTKQVLVNLLDNAIRYTRPNGEVRIALAGPDENDQVWASVADQGPGIPPDALPHVWERFFKADRSRRRDSGGTGLGLAIARSIVEAQGGRVRASSVVGEGTTFAFSLPAADRRLAGSCQQCSGGADDSLKDGPFYQS